MIKKLYALASVTALGGFVAAVGAAGCTSPKNDDGPREEVSEVDPTTEDKDTDPTDPATSGEGGAPAGSACKAKISYEAEEIKPPAPRTQVCTAEEIKALADACAEDANAQKCADARGGPGNAECASCIFGVKDDARWKVINLQPGETPGARYNQEGCIDHVTGVEGCGHAYVTVLGCFNDFCARCPQEEARACVKEVADGECNAYLIKDQDCGAALGEKELEVDSCFPKSPDIEGAKALFVYMASVACGPEPEPVGAD